MNEQQIDSLVEKMVDLSDSLRDLRMDARAEGLHMMALNFLVNARTEFPHDKGANVFREVLRYAQATGSNLELGDSIIADNVSNFQTEAEKNSPVNEDLNTQPVRSVSRMNQGNKKCLLKEIFLGTIIAASLLWLLRY